MAEALTRSRARGWGLSMSRRNGDQFRGSSSLRRMALPLLLACLWAVDAAAAMITTASGSVSVYSAGGRTVGRSIQFYSQPFIGTESTFNSITGAYAESTYDITSAGIDITYYLSRPPTYPDVANEMALTEGYVDFMVDEPTPYVLSGEMATIDPEGRNTTQRLRLYSGGTLIFENSQFSNATPNEQFVLGRQEGDANNTLLGSLTGTLLPNRTYRFEYFSRLFDEPRPSYQTATATGFYSLVIIPEPTTGVLMMLGVAGLSPTRSRHT